jgi:hypothetical protein
MEIDRPESYYLREEHEPIIDRATWNTVKERLDAHRQLLRAGVKCVGQAHYLYGKIFCGLCGAPMTRRTLRAYSRCTEPTVYYKAWTCKERHKGRRGNGCRNRTIREEEVLAATRAHCDIAKENESMKMYIYPNKITFRLHNRT